MITKKCRTIYAIGHFTVDILNQIEVQHISRIFSVWPPSHHRHCHCQIDANSSRNTFTILDGKKTKAANVQFTGKLFVVKIWGKKRTNRSFCRNGLEQIIIISPLNEKKRGSNWFDRYCILTRRPNASHLSAYLFVWQFTAIFIYDMRYS